MNSTPQPIFGPHFLLAADSSVHGEDTPENRELVRRIHACLNACEGISTDELEAGIIQDMCRAVAGIVPILRERMEPKGVHIRAGEPASIGV
jgi:hypothetical protein